MAYKKFKCSREDHEQPALFICTSTNNPNNLFSCANCITDKFQDNTFVEIKACINRQKSNIIQNWPPGISSDVSRLLQKKQKKKEIKKLKKLLINQTNEEFNLLLSSTQSHIKVAHKKALAKIETYFQLLQQNAVLKEYNRVSRRDKLRDTLLNKANENITAFFAKMYLSKEINFQALNKLLEINISFNSDQMDKVIKATAAIFEELDVVEVKGFEEKKLECSFIKLLDFSNSEMFTVIQNDRLSPTTIKNNKANGCVYSDLILHTNKKYVVRFKFNRPFYQMNETIIGVCSFDIAGKVRISHHRIQNSSINDLEQNSSSYQFDSVDWQYKDSVSEIEMRVYIYENILIFSDYPNYRISISQIPRNISKTPFKLGEQFRIGIQMKYDKSLDKTLIVESVYEVNEFPPINRQ